MFKRVLLCYDGSEASRNALKRGAKLAMLLQSRVSVLSVIPGDELDPGVAASAAGIACVAESKATVYRKILDESLAWLKAKDVVAEGFLASGNPVEQISEHARRLQADLIVLGYYPKPSGGFWWSKGSRTTLAERTRCCILVASEPDPE
jgi:nucleotide-binding universal stress UspA family protein